MVNIETALWIQLQLLRVSITDIHLFRQLIRNYYRSTINNNNVAKVGKRKLIIGWVLVIIYYISLFYTTIGTWIHKVEKHGLRVNSRCSATNNNNNYDDDSIK